MCKSTKYRWNNRKKNIRLTYLGVELSVRKKNKGIWRRQDDGTYRQMCSV